jgi:DNA polymerase I
LEDAGVRVLVAASAGPASRWVLQRVDDASSPLGEPWPVDELAPAVVRLEGERPRWVWAATGAVYPALLAAGVRVERCHDLALTEGLLSAHEVRPAQVRAGVGPAVQDALFADSRFADSRFADSRFADSLFAGEGIEALRAADRGQRDDASAASAVSPGFPLLVAAESAAALAAAEMSHVGLPWRADVHDEVLTGLLGERPRHGGRPPKLQALAAEVAQALGGEAVNLDSPADLLRAFRRQGVLLKTTRAGELKTIDHPAIEPLLHYKELARLHVAHGWAWRDAWVREGRFKPEYVPGGVVSGRWATRGGGALQIPRSMRAAAVADPGWVLVVADAGQLEPRLLAALSDDPGMVAATQAGDLYTDIATQALGRPDARAEAKVALLSAMYGGGSTSPALAALRRRFPRALELLENAARIGEDGGVVRSVLGRTSPPPNPAGRAGTDGTQATDAAALGRSRARGRFTRNFVVQASAADWANVLVAGLRRRLCTLPTTAGRADLVFFQHDEVVVHAPAELTADVVEAIASAGAEATALVVGDRGVQIPLTGTPVSSYADKP